MATVTDLKMTVAEIAAFLGGRVVGDGEVSISGVGSLRGAGPDRIGFLGDARYREQALSSRAGALIVGEELPLDKPQVVVDQNPYAAFARLMGVFHPRPRFEPGVHPGAVVAETAELGEGVHVGAGAVVAEGVTIGARSAVGANAVVGAGSKVGADTIIYAGVILYPGVEVGSRVIVHSGTVLGADGFGFILSNEGHIKKPQVGGVIIEDDVEIGAGCAIDRAMLDHTVVGKGTKIDNMVHLAHNARVGKHCIILANTAIGGSVTIGDGVIISGGVTVKDGVEIGDRAVVVGASGVLDNVPPGETVWGMPAIPFSHAKRVYSRLKQLPELFKRVRSLERSGK